MPEDDFPAFYAASYARIVGLVLVLLADRGEAEDIAQEAFARALRRWPRIRTYDAPEAWVRRVALRLAVDARRRVARAIRASQAVRAAAPEHLAHHDPDLAARDALRTALLALPYRQREAIVLHYLADLPVTQIAADLRLPPSTVKTRLAAGQRRLERELTDDTQEVLDER